MREPNDGDESGDANTGDENGADATEIIATECTRCGHILAATHKPDRCFRCRSTAIVVVSCAITSTQGGLTFAIETDEDD
jgi:ribosomal protein S27AE